MSTLTVFSDYACPWCYLGVSRLDTVLASQDEAVTEIAWVHYPLSPDTPPEGRDLGAYLRGKGIPISAASRLADICAAEGLAYPREVEGRRVWNTQRAQELAIWAAERLTPAAMLDLHRRLFVAYHVDNLNVYDVEVLVTIAQAVGLDPELARAALAGDTYATKRRDDWASAMQSGVRGVPTFVREQEALVGAQPAAALEALLAKPTAAAH